MPSKALLAALAAIAGCLLLTTCRPSGKAGPEEEKSLFSEARLQYDLDLVKDPRTGQIPPGAVAAERLAAQSIPLRESQSFRLTSPSNVYRPAGPLNGGGRTRAIAYDIRYNGTTNRVILAGGVSGGILRSADAGQSWQTVAPNIDIHSFGALAQDPRPGFQDTWYAGGGEAYGSSTTTLSGDLYLGHGLLRSTDNGLTWTRMPFSSFRETNGQTISEGTLEGLDHPLDNVHRILVHPQTGHIYLAGYNAIMRSTDNGQSFQMVFQPNSQPSQRAGQTEITFAGSRILIAVNGSNPDAAARGVWISSTGDAGSFQRIAGGSTSGVDAVAGWRGNVVNAADPYLTYGKRIVMAAAPSNPSIVYLAYVNGLRAFGADPKPEIDLFRMEINGNNFTWTDRSLNLPAAAPNNILTIQLGYDLFLAVKPDNPDVVFLGAVQLYRSANGFATTSSTSVLTGVHLDQHYLTFAPNNPNEGLLANDGGLYRSTFLHLPTPTWLSISNYQTLQYYQVSMDPESGRNNFTGGSQDNGISFRDASAVFNTPASDSNRHRYLLVADGASTGIAKKNGNTQYVYAAWQLSNILRYQSPSTTGVSIRPDGLTPNGGFGGFGEFITNFELDQDNSEDLYFVNFNRLFRTTSASTVTPSSGWTELSGVSAAVAPGNPTTNTQISIRGMALTRGPYLPSHSLYFGTTNGKIFRLDNPRESQPGSAPVEITPAGLTGNVQDLAVNPNDDNEVIAVVSNYNTTSIWWTNQAKADRPSWKNAEGNLSLPSVRSCVIVVKKDAAGQPVTEYYVGTSVGLYSTENLGAVLMANGSPVWMREGGNVLNYPIVQSMAYRPSDNVLLIGTHGNGMYYAQVGSPNFQPNSVTSVSPVVNDPSFIRNIYPTVGKGNLHFSRGTLTGVQKIRIQVFTTAGQSIHTALAPYADGSIPLQQRGHYVVIITSENRKYRHVQKVIRP